MDWIVIGFDPGSYHTGYAVVQYGMKSGVIRIIDAGTIHDKNENPLIRIANIYDGVCAILKKHQALNRNILVVAERFFAKNMFGADLPPKIMGTLMLASIKELPAERSWYIEYNKRSINKSVTGYGGSKKRKVTKKDISTFLQAMFKLPAGITDNMDEHSWDALACCVTAINKFDFKGKEDSNEDTGAETQK